MPPNTLKVLSYNIHKGFGASNKKFVLPAIREAIEKVPADIVLLQEVLGRHSLHEKRQDWPAVSQAEFLSERNWPHFKYGKNAIYAHGHHGNAILSKFPIAFSENIDISTNRLEQRGFLHVGLEVPWLSQPLHVICLHLGLFERGRAIQVNNLCDRIKTVVPAQAPLVIGGDFNDWRQRATGSLESKLGLREVFCDHKGGHARTFPSWLPMLKLDRIYFRDLRVHSADRLSGAPWRQLSDHAAIVAELH